jgi:phosphatidylglycerol---prolipoprotein diacylglyceryl transferase
VLSITFPVIDPVLVHIGPFAIRWYALSYIAGILLGIAYITYLNKRTHAFTAKALDDLMVYAVIGILLGGRLGYVFFYNAGYYLDHPSDILKIWQGGMSFHGGMIGLITAIFILCRKNSIEFLRVADMIACAAPIGLCLGRIANFINGELYGRVTDVPWGIVFPDAGPLPRHPSQLYESLLEGLLLFVMMAILVFFTKALQRKGLLLGVFFTGYSIARSIVENFREPDSQLGFIVGHMTMGQVLSLPMTIIGAILIIRALLTSPSKNL